MDMDREDGACARRNLLLNIFRIKLASEIRYYGLLKTIGVTAA